MKQIFLSIVLLSCVFYETKATDSCEKGLLPKAPCCGIANKKPVRIVHGTKAERNEFPWMVYISFAPVGCGGSLINSRWVLSAAHCFVDDKPVMVYLGAHSCNNGVCTENAKAIKVKKVFSHKGYIDGFVNSAYDDISLLELAEPVSFSDTIKPICLPIAADQHFNEKDAIVSGWGLTEKGDFSPELLKTTLKIWNSKKCEAFDKYLSGKVILNSTYQICAGGESDGSCKGDSGGPLFLQLNNIKENEPYYQVGIVSFGVESCKQEGYPEVYTNVANYIKWIQTTISENQ